MMVTKYLCLYVCGLFLAINISSLGCAETIQRPVNKNPIDRSLQMNKDSISADLNNVPLNQILQHISKQTNIWFQVNNALLNEKVTIEFSELPIEEGLKRILTNLNYSMSYDAKGRLTGLIIIESSKSDVNTHSGLSSNTSMIKGNLPTSEKYKKVHDKDQTIEETESSSISISGAIPIRPRTIPKRPPGAENIKGSATALGVGRPQGVKEENQ
ncbi:hypothetical protein ACFL1Z_01915 [Thermodesulfobacteriota bacterium]